MAFQSALSNDWHLTSIAGVSYLGVTTDHLQHVQFAERRGRARRQFFCHRIALSKALTNIFSDEPPSKGFVVCGTNRHRRHQWRPVTSNQGTQSLFPDTIRFQWNLDWTLDCSHSVARGKPIRTQKEAKEVTKSLRREDIECSSRTRKN